MACCGWVSLNNVYTLFLWWDTCDQCYWA
jgi:hypothetical protein